MSSNKKPMLFILLTLIILVHYINILILFLLEYLLKSNFWFPNIITIVESMTHLRRIKEQFLVIKATFRLTVNILYVLLFNHEIFNLAFNMLIIN